MAGKRSTLGVSSIGELDIDILKVVWKMKKVTVKDVFEALYERRRLAYTTIMTVMGRLAKKGMLSQDRTRMPYEYAPIVQQTELAVSIIKQVIERLVEGPPDAIIAALTKDMELKKQLKQPKSRTPNPLQNAIF